MEIVLICKTPENDVFSRVLVSFIILHFIECNTNTASIQSLLNRKAGLKSYIAHTVIGVWLVCHDKQGSINFC